jgi:hypothetical protein
MAVIKSWVVLYRHNGRLRWLTLGTYSALNLANAREQAREALTDVQKGTAVAEVKQEERRGDTFGELAERYKHAKVKNKLRHAAREKGVIKMDLCSPQGAEPKISCRIKGASQKSRRRRWRNGVSAPERVHVVPAVN